MPPRCASGDGIEEAAGGGNVACADDELSWIVGRLDGGVPQPSRGGTGGGV